MYITISKIYNLLYTITFSQMANAHIELNSISLGVEKCEQKLIYENKSQKSEAV